MTGLHLVVYFGVDKVVQFLISSDSSDLEDSYGRTPLSYTTRNRYKAVVKLLVDEGTELETKSYNYRMPLSYAARSRHEAVVKLLVDKGTELETKAQSSQTPLL